MSRRRRRQRSIIAPVAVACGGGAAAVRGWRAVAGRRAPQLRACAAAAKMIADTGYLQRIGFEPTEKAYFDDAATTSEATVRGVVRVFADASGEGSSSPAVVLDRTVFHPQGGGQPSDTGIVETIDGSARFEVMLCRADAATGVVTHGGRWLVGSETDMPPGTSVRLTVDGEKRLLHSRIHSAGHAIDVAVSKLAAAGNEYAAGLVPTKGYHFPDAPSVEYRGKVPADAAEAMVGELQAVLDDLVREDIATICKEVLASEVDPNYLATGFPLDEKLRVVGVAGNLLCPCGGTHVDTSSALRGLKITRVKTKKGATKVSYVVE